MWLSILISFFSIILSLYNFVPYDSFVYWIPIYLFGARINDTLLERINKLSQAKVFFMSSAIILLLYIFFSWFLPNGIAGNEMTIQQNAVYIGFRFFTPIVWLLIICYMNRCHISEREYMKYSFFVYCTHWFLIVIISLLLDHLMDGCELLKFFIMVFSTYFLCVLLGMTFKRYTLSLWSVLNGRR